MTVAGACAPKHGYGTRLAAKRDLFLQAARDYFDAKARGGAAAADALAELGIAATDFVRVERERAKTIGGSR